MLTVFFVLAVLAFIMAVMSAAGKCPAWVPIILLALIALLRAMPLGR